ncbi:hypothetical protein FT663_01976 [Candidozyma haemuli var. vulneris]|uniref:Uncharacterized protein n=1 Tax=Candidozyma haemuli TaxID=45357 RepID=A0A2V1AW16_9ASCO|nr:hypothetical protein CXQ85_000036 [[Candida] haemuloni]KAF3988629.1 hypothetical protein FT662_03308 [[Candida] haemuloni var. vulneris]KAF3993228.1 hypothetical protein FT663_01976 [[Candida] haemuloni var. vulneris]PVH21071.1 hypothetical protein CXQ85_000036 [[Candida] haemuloni]
MISRGILRGARLYSTSGDSKGSALFLSDLMKRVDAISAKSQQIKAREDEAKKARGESTLDTKKADGGKSQGNKHKTQRKPSNNNAARNQQLKVADHPLGDSTFNSGNRFRERSNNNGQNKNGERKTFQNRNREGRNFQNREGRSFQNRNTEGQNFQEKKTEGSLNFEGQKKNFRERREASGSAETQDRKPFNNRDKPRRNATRSQEDGNQTPRKAGSPRSFTKDRQTNRPRRDRNTGRYGNRDGDKDASTAIATKKIESVAYKPSINGDTFFYGKATSALAGDSARVSAVAKEFLIKSRYPYKLPKSIIDSVQPGIVGNRFLLQKDWKLGVNPEEFKSRMREVFKGEVQQVTPDKATPKDVLPVIEDAAQVLMKNGTYSVADKKIMLDVASGITSPKQLLQNAHWVK